MITNGLKDSAFSEKFRLGVLLFLILLLGFTITFSLWSYLSSLLGACTLYVVVREQMIWLTEKKKISKRLSASLLLVEVTVFFLIPLSGVVLLLVNKLQNTSIDFSVLMNKLNQLLQIIKEETGIDMFSGDAMQNVSKMSGRILQLLLGGISNFFINAMLLLFVLYFMLENYKNLEKYAHDLLPFREENKKKLLHETKIIINSNALGIPLIALVQGSFAFLGYWIFGLGSPILLGVFTGISSIIPLVGTGIVWVPVCLSLFLSRDWGSGFGMLLYSVVIITNVDGVARLIFQKKIGDIHPLITIFGVMIGLYVFGFWGIIFGPLVLSLFCLFVDIFKRQYISDNSHQSSIGSE